MKATDWSIFYQCVFFFFFFFFFFNKFWTFLEVINGKHSLPSGYPRTRPPQQMIALQLPKLGQGQHIYGCDDSLWLNVLYTLLMVEITYEWISSASVMTPSSHYCISEVTPWELIPIM